MIDVGVTKRAIDSLGPDCCGCGACAAVCPRACIRMEEDANGFARPCVDEPSCISCGACDRTCPQLRQKGSDGVERVLWAQARSEEELRTSSSGGVFGVLARDALSRGGAVVGAAYDGEAERVRHVVVETMDELSALRSSKYVQSSVSREVYHVVRDALRAGREVLFSGTACQVAGLRSFLGDSGASDRLLCVEVVCHGVPSPLLWRRWLDRCGEEFGSRVCSVSFRDKRTGWSSYSITYACEDGSSHSHLASDDWYLRAFLNNASLRPSCLSCRSKGHCGSDVTLGDFWGYDGPSLRHRVQRYGVSCAIARTERGRRALERVENALDCGESSFDAVAAGNPALVESSRPHARYEEFMSLLAQGRTCDELIAEFPFTRPLSARVLSRAAAFVRRLGW